MPRLQPSNLGDQRLDIGLQDIGGNTILTLNPLAGVDVHVPNGMKNCLTLKNTMARKSAYLESGCARNG